MNTSLKKNKKPLLVGLTGGIGSGKSTVAKIFIAMGIPVFNADEQAKTLLNFDKEVKQQIFSVFGDIYINNQLNTTKLAEVVFNDKQALKKLNKIVHPAVGKKFKKWVDENKKYPVLIKEAAILIESGAYKDMDKIILVKSKEDTRIKRVMKRNNISEEEVRARIKNQMGDSEKEKYCDYIIENENMMLIPQVLEIVKQLKSPD